MTDPDPSTRAIIEWLATKLLGLILDTQQTQFELLKENDRQLEERMSALSDYMEQFRADADAQTTRIGNELAALKDRLDQGDTNALTEVSAALDGHITTLRAMGTGDQDDPLPTPDVPADPGDTI